MQRVDICLVPVIDLRGRSQDLSLSVLVGGPRKAWQGGGAISSCRRPKCGQRSYRPAPRLPSPGFPFPLSSFHSLVTATGLHQHVLLWPCCFPVALVEDVKVCRDDMSIDLGVELSFSQLLSATHDYSFLNFELSEK